MYNTHVRYFALLLLLAGMSAASHAHAQVPGQCRQCQTNSSSSCASSCKRKTPVKHQQRACYEACLRRVCGGICRAEKKRQKEISEAGGSRPESAAADFYSSSETCEQCQERNFAGPCVEICANTAVPSRCKKSCAKRRCAKNCQLPAAGREKQKVEPSKKDCLACENSAAQRCDDPCGDKSRPGYKSCVVSCISQRCLKTCNPNLF